MPIFRSSRGSFPGGEVLIDTYAFGMHEDLTAHSDEHTERFSLVLFSWARGIRSGSVFVPACRPAVGGDMIDSMQLQCGNERTVLAKDIRSSRLNFLVENPR